MGTENNFRFKQFNISHAGASMKVGTDAILLGSWTDVSNTNKILDIGTGCGIIALMLAQRSQAIIDAIDIDKSSIDEAAINFDNSPWKGRLRSIHSSVQDFSKKTNTKYDLIVSNPPYVDSEDMSGLAPEYSHEPALGLASGNDGLDSVLTILHDASRFLADDGILVVEVGNSQAALAQRFPAAEFTWLEFAMGGQGVFLLSARDLVRHQDSFSEAAAALHSNLESK